MRIEPREPIHILILGPMALRNNAVAVEPRTRDLKALVEDITRRIRADATLQLPDFVVRSPEDRLASVIVPGVMGLIEEAELVIADLSGESANVAYEIGLVHALGIPHVLITDRAQPPFYFLMHDHIAGFSVATTYDATRAGHANLRQKILDFASKPGVAAGLSDNQIAQYYHLPIVDISGPSGLAAGYYINAIRRFVRPNGFFDAPCTIFWKISRDPAEAPLERQLRVEHFIAVRPPDLATRTYGQDSQALNEALRQLGLGLRFATIQKRPDELLDIRDYGGQFLVRDQGTGDFVEPCIIVEVPTTLYALPYVPRIRKIGEVQAGVLHNIRTVVEQKRRRLDDMLQRFEVNLRYQIEQDRGGVADTRVQMIDLPQVEATLRALPGVLGP